MINDHTTEKSPFLSRFERDPDFYMRTALGMHPSTRPASPKSSAPAGSIIEGTQLCCYRWYTVATSEFAVIEEFGKFKRLEGPGLQRITNAPLCCCFEVLVGTMTTKVQEIKIHAETKTLDNVFLVIELSIQYQVMGEAAYVAFYTLRSHEDAIIAYAQDSLRSYLSRVKMDAAFENKEELSKILGQTLNEKLQPCGYRIVNALVTGMDPDHGVKEAMNEINTAKRERQAAIQRAEANKVIRVKEAEAMCESQYLSGVGLARQRKALMDGMHNQIKGYPEGLDRRGIMEAVVLNMYYDTMGEIGSNPACKTVYTQPT